MTSNQISERSNNFNLLRFFFASLVIVSHAPELKFGDRTQETLSGLFGTISFGELAVQGFFILSGFLIVKSWQEKPKVLHYLVSRTLRIYPGFIACSFFCAFILGPFYGAQNYLEVFELKKFLKGLVGLSPPIIPKVFENSHYPDINGAMWSISYEFKCYLLVMATGLLSLRTTRIFWPSLFIISAAIYFSNSIQKVEFWLYVYVRCAMAFASGACFYLYRDKIVWNKTLALVTACLTSLFLFSKALVEPALCIFFGYLVLYVAVHSRPLFNFNMWPDISYGVYLYAWPINKVLLWHYPTLDTGMLILAVFGLSVAFGTVSWYAIEKPSLKLKKFFYHQR
jgi:peptidoglycan/LPS O-acetylase OafA/YrhL